MRKILLFIRKLQVIATLSMCCIAEYVLSQTITLNNNFTFGGTTIVSGTVFTKLAALSPDGSVQYQSPSPDDYVLTKKYDSNYWYLAKELGGGLNQKYARTANNLFLNVPCNALWEHTSVLAVSFTPSGTWTQLFFTGTEICLPSCEPIIFETSNGNMSNLLSTAPGAWNFKAGSPSAFLGFGFEPPSFYTPDANTIFYKTGTGVILGPPTYHIGLKVMYRQNHVWRIAVRSFIGSSYTDLTQIYETTTGGYDVAAPCNAFWKAPVLPIQVINVPIDYSMPAPPFPILAGPSATFTGSPLIGFLDASICQCTQPCTFQQNVGVMVSGVMTYYWNEPANWSCGIVPSYSQPVTIPSGTSVTLSSNVHMENVSIFGTLNMAGFTLTYP